MKCESLGDCCLPFDTAEITVRFAEDFGLKANPLVKQAERDKIDDLEWIEFEHGQLRWFQNADLYQRMTFDQRHSASSVHCSRVGLSMATELNPDVPFNRALGAAGSLNTERERVSDAAWCLFPDPSSLSLSSERWLCVLHSNTITLLSPQGEVHYVALPCLAHSLWVLPEGLLVESRDSFPTLFSLMNCSDEVRPVSVLPSDSLTPVLGTDLSKKRHHRGTSQASSSADGCSESSLGSHVHKPGHVRGMRRSVSAGLTGSRMLDFDEEDEDGDQDADGGAGREESTPPTSLGDITALMMDDELLIGMDADEDDDEDNNDEISPLRIPSKERPTNKDDNRAVLPIAPETMFFDDSDECIVFSSVKLPLMVTYNANSGLHSLWRVFQDCAQLSRRMRDLDPMIGATIVDDNGSFDQFADPPNDESSVQPEITVERVWVENIDKISEGLSKSEMPSLNESASVLLCSNWDRRPLLGFFYESSGVFATYFIDDDMGLTLHFVWNEVDSVRSMPAMFQCNEGLSLDLLVLRKQKISIFSGPLKVSELDLTGVLSEHIALLSLLNCTLGNSSPVLTVVTKSLLDFYDHPGASQHQSTRVSPLNCVSVALPNWNRHRSVCDCFTVLSDFVSVDFIHALRLVLVALWSEYGDPCLWESFGQCILFFVHISTVQFDESPLKPALINSDCHSSKKSSMSESGVSKQKAFSTMESGITELFNTDIHQRMVSQFGDLTFGLDMTEQTERKKQSSKVLKTTPSVSCFVELKYARSILSIIRRYRESDDCYGMTGLFAKNLARLLTEQDTFGILLALHLYAESLKLNSQSWNEHSQDSRYYIEVSKLVVKLALQLHLHSYVDHYWRLIGPSILPDPSLIQSGLKWAVQHYPDRLVTRVPSLFPALSSAMQGDSTPLLQFPANIFGDQNNNQQSCEFAKKKHPLSLMTQVCSFYSILLEMMIHPESQSSMKPSSPDFNTAALPSHQTRMCFSDHFDLLGSPVVSRSPVSDASMGDRMSPFTPLSFDNGRKTRTRLFTPSVGTDADPSLKADDKTFEQCHGSSMIKPRIGGASFLEGLDPSSAAKNHPSSLHRRGYRLITPVSMIKRRRFTVQSNPVDRMVMEMVRQQFTLDHLSSLPFAVGRPLQDVLDCCRERPPLTWPNHAYSLIGREDLISRRRRSDPNRNEVSESSSLSKPRRIPLAVRQSDSDLRGWMDQSQSSSLGSSFMPDSMIEDRSALDYSISAGSFRYSGLSMYSSNADDSTLSRSQRNEKTEDSLHKKKLRVRRLIRRFLEPPSYLDRSRRAFIQRTPADTIGSLSSGFTGSILRSDGGRTDVRIFSFANDLRQSREMEEHKQFRSFGSAHGGNSHSFHTRGMKEKPNHFNFDEDSGERQTMADVDGTIAVCLDQCRYRFPKDSRLSEVRKLLRCDRVWRVPNCEVRAPHAGAAAGVALQPTLESVNTLYNQLQLLKLSSRVLATSLGRAALCLWSLRPLVTSKLRMPRVKCKGWITGKLLLRLDFDVIRRKSGMGGAAHSGGGGGGSSASSRAHQSFEGVISSLDRLLPGQVAVHEYCSWPRFHNGVASGLRVVPEAFGGCDTSRSLWINLNNPRVPSMTHAGFLFAMGLNGLLPSLKKQHLFSYLQTRHSGITVALLLGLSVAHRGSGNEQTYRSLCIHLPCLMPSVSELDISPVVQSAAVFGIGLLFLQSGDQSLSKKILTFAVKRSLSIPSKYRALYALCSLLSVGLLNLGRGRYAKDYSVARDADGDGKSRNDSHQSISKRLIDLFGGAEGRIVEYRDVLSEKRFKHGSYHNKNKSMDEEDNKDMSDGSTALNTSFSMNNTLDKMNHDSRRTTVTMMTTLKNYGSDSSKSSVMLGDIYERSSLSKLMEPSEYRQLLVSQMRDMEVNSHIFDHISRSHELDLTDPTHQLTSMLDDDESDLSLDGPLSSVFRSNVTIDGSKQSPLSVSDSDNPSGDGQHYYTCSPDGCSLDTQWMDPRVASPGAILAFALIHLRSNRLSMANHLRQPSSESELDRTTPTLVYLRSVGSNLIMWDRVQPSTEWITRSVSPWLMNEMDRSELDHSTDILSAVLSAKSGLCFVMALKHAGSQSKKAYSAIRLHCDFVVKLRNQARMERNHLRKKRKVKCKEYASLLDPHLLENCLCSLMLSLSIVMAGSGHLGTLKYFRSLCKHKNNDSECVTFGHHLARSLAIGLLFLGGGRATIGTRSGDLSSDLAIASLVISCYPLWCVHTMDDHTFLQPLRYLWLLSVQPRYLITVDIDTNKPLSLPVQIFYESAQSGDHSRKYIRRNTPCILPSLYSLIRLKVESHSHWPLDYDGLKSNPHAWKSIIRDHCVVLSVKRKTPELGSSSVSVSRPLSRLKNTMDNPCSSSVMCELIEHVVSVIVGNPLNDTNHVRSDCIVLLMGDVLSNLQLWDVYRSSHLAKSIRHSPNSMMEDCIHRIKQVIFNRAKSMDAQRSASLLHGYVENGPSAWDGSLQNYHLLQALLIFSELPTDVLLRTAVQALSKRLNRSKKATEHTFLPLLRSQLFKLTRLLSDKQLKSSQSGTQATVTTVSLSHSCSPALALLASQLSSESPVS